MFTSSWLLCRNKTWGGGVIIGSTWKRPSAFFGREVDERSGIEQWSDIPKITNIFHFIIDAKLLYNAYSFLSCSGNFASKISIFCYVLMNNKVLLSFICNTIV